MTDAECPCGQAVSCSPRACLIRFIGGPYDGRSGLYDHDEWTRIGLAIDKKLWQWKRTGPREYTLSETFDQPTNRSKTP